MANSPYSIQITNAAEFNATMKRYSRAMGKDMGDLVAETAGLACDKLLYQTEPFGNSAKVGARFEKNIAKQAHRARRAHNFGGPAPGHSMDDAHRSARIGRRTQVPKDMRGRKGGTRSGPFIDAGTAREDINRAMARAGLAKAGWHTAKLAIPGLRNTRRPAAWLKRHIGKGGSATRAGGGDQTTIVIVNTVPYVRNLLRDAKIRSALLAAYNGKLRQWRATLAARARKA